MKYNKIIDAHAHIFPPQIAYKAAGSIGAYYNLKMFADGTIESLLKNGKEINVYKYLVHSTATKVGQIQSINNFIAESKDENSCFIGFGTLHPKMQNVESEVDRIISLGLKGVKLHPEFQKFYIDDESMFPIYAALEGKLPILMHTGDSVKTSSSPKRLAKILEKFPNLVVIAAHFGGYDMWDESIEYLVGRKNVYFDTCSSLFKMDLDKARKIIRDHGADKVLFGTDYPMWSHLNELNRFEKLELTDEECELILHKNAEKLLGIE